MNLEAIRSLLDVPLQPLEEMIERWSAARTRSLLATMTHQRTPEIDDLLSQLTYATSITREVTPSRWCAIAQLLQWEMARMKQELALLVDMRTRNLCDERGAQARMTEVLEISPATVSQPASETVGLVAASASRTNVREHDRGRRC